MLRHAFGILFLALFLLPSAWAGNTVALILSDNSAPYKEFAAGFYEAMQDKGWEVNLGLAEQAESGNASLIVTVGVDAFRQSLQKPGNTPILGTLIGRQIYQKLLNDSGRPRKRSSAIYIEQAYNRQAQFIHALLPDKTRAGVLVSTDSRHELGTIRQALQANGLTLDSEDSDHDESLLPASNALFERIQILLATPDPKIYKRDQIKTLLLTSYRHRKPVIAFSSAFVTAGALAAIYSTPKQLARQAAQMVLNHGSNLPPAEYPDQFAIAINRSVADALGLSLPDEAELRRALNASKESR